MKNMPRSVVLMNKRYKVCWRKPPQPKKNKDGTEIIGLCDSPNNKDKKIHINPHLDEDQLFEIICHEILHGLFFTLDEETIDQAGKDISTFLKKCGYTRQSNGNTEQRKVEGS